MSDDATKRTTVKEETRAILALEDGMVFEGISCGAAGETSGELCFNTAMAGYQEIMTDLSYAGQLLVMTYPQIGNYGVNAEDAQSDRIALRGVIVRDMCRTPSNFRSEGTLPDLLIDQDVVAIEGIDTRKLTRHIRDKGAMRAVLSTIDLNADSLVRKAQAVTPIEEVDLVSTVTCGEPYTKMSTCGAVEEMAADEAQNDSAALKVVAYDFGIKRSIIDGLAQAGCDVTVVPASTSAKEVLDLKPDGVFFSNGPGDPTAVAGVSEQVKKIIGAVPIFGICLGHQLICRAAGADTEKLKYGHHGGNQPVENLKTGKVEITSQNHGFGITFESLGTLVEEDLTNTPPVVMNPQYGRIALTHVNLNDGTAEGVEFLDHPVFSVQYHPEASPGPSDSAYLFEQFTEMMAKAGQS